MSAHPASPVLPRVAVLAVTLLALLPVLSGCASIPHSGPVVPGRAVVADPREGIVQLGGSGPVPGATAEGIVTGFLRVAAGFSNDHQVARSFLSPKRRLAWRPDAAVSVYPSQSQLKVKEIGAKPIPESAPVPSNAGTVGDDSGGNGSGDNSRDGAARADVRDRAEATRVTVTTPVEATIDRDGRYEIAPPGKTVTATFGLIKMDGEWRINALADGILIAAVDFAVTYRAFPVYFGDPTGRYLVPDVHWFPGIRDNLTAPELPTALVRVLLQGPPPWLADAVVTGAPPNTSMAVGAVVVADDVATVDLTDQVRTADTPSRQLLASQLQATLGQLSTIGSVQITVRRLAFDVPAGSAGENDPSQPDGQPVADPQVDARPVLINAKGRLARLDNGTLGEVKDVGGLAVPGANRPAVSNDSTAYAVLTADRRKLLRQLPGGKAVSLVSPGVLTAPSFDPLGWAWAAPGPNTGFVYAMAANAAAVKVKAPWLKGANVVSMRMSRDGTRAVVAVQIRGHAHLFVTGVQRGAGGLPVTLSQPPRGLFPDLKTVDDVAWVDEDEVVVLGRRAGTTEERPWEVQIGGVLGPAGAPVSGADSITAGNGELSVMAGTGKGVVARSGALWETVSPGRWPAFPG